MSDETAISINSSETQMLTAEYKDGQLQIVEVTPFNKDNKNESILTDEVSSDSGHKYMQVLDPDKGLVQLDLLNLTLVRCDDGEESYRLVTNSESEAGEIGSDVSVTCVLQSSDNEDQEQGSYVMVEGDEGLVFLQPSSSDKPEPAEPPEKKSKKSASPQEIMEKFKALQKAKEVMSSQSVRLGKRGRRRAAELPSPQELLTSPNFRLYLYSCKMCSFKCNAIKELAAHRNSEHSGGSRQAKTSYVGRAFVTLQCARCPFRGATHPQLLKHVQTKHIDNTDMTNKVSLDSKEVEEADVLVCGACGFESADRQTFRHHIESEHGATT